GGARGGSPSIGYSRGDLPAPSSIVGSLLTELGYFLDGIYPRGFRPSLQMGRRRAAGLKSASLIQARFSGNSASIHGFGHTADLGGARGGSPSIGYSRGDLPAPSSIVGSLLTELGYFLDGIYPRGFRPSLQMGRRRAAGLKSASLIQARFSGNSASIHGFGHT